MARAIPSAPSASALRGLWFVFEHAGHHLGLWVSAITGKEEVYLNEALVAESRKIALNSTHTVNARGATYTLALSTKSVRHGAFQCVLHVDGAPVAGLETEYIARGKWQQSLATLFGALVVTYLVYTQGGPLWLAAAGLAAVAAASYAWFGRKSGYVIRPMRLTTAQSNLRPG